MDEPAFSEPWHAHVFAITVHLQERGLFVWSDWTQRFGATLKRHGHAKDLNGGDDYFIAWLETLETLLREHSQTTDGEIAEMVSLWTAAYLRTPHGQPVKLDG